MKNKIYDLNDLIKVMADLRDPRDGCPWDLEQDFKSIAPYTLEEAYEVVDAIQKGDMTELREELGDLLFQSIYHAQLAKEAGHFDIHNVIHDITHKMIHRHPHVFGDETAKAAADVDAIWDKQKSQENGKTASDNDSILDGVPKALPSLLRSSKLQKRAAKVGFEWNDISGVLDKLEEEIAELREAAANGGIAHIAEELGDTLFILANYGRMQGINPEEALRQTCEKFERRFRGLEQALKDENIALDEASLEQMEEKWQREKQKEKQ